MKSIKNESVRQAYGIAKKKETIGQSSAPELRLGFGAPEREPTPPMILCFYTYPTP